MSVLKKEEKGIVIGCGDGGIKLLEVQLEGKRVMDVLSFLRGIRGGIEVV